MASLADLQTEREKLRPFRPSRPSRPNSPPPPAKPTLLASAGNCRRVLLDIMAELPQRLLEAIEGEHDETRVHYLLSDAAHDILKHAGEACEAASQPIASIGERIKRGAKPRDLLTVSQWPTVTAGFAPEPTAPANGEPRSPPTCRRSWTASPSTPPSAPSHSSRHPAWAVRLP